MYHGTWGSRALASWDILNQSLLNELCHFNYGLKTMLSVTMLNNIYHLVILNHLN